MSLYNKLSDEEFEDLRGHYLNDELFRHWSPILCDIERIYGDCDAVSLWACSEECLSYLRSKPQYREIEIDYLFRLLSKEGNDTIAVTVMSIVLIRLMNAVEKGKENDFFDNEPMCLAIMRNLNKCPYKQLSSQIFHVFFEQKIGLDGNPVEFHPLDPMKHNLTMDELSEGKRIEVEQLKNNIIQITHLLKKYWGETVFDVWKRVWEDICLNARLFKLIRTKNPNTNKNTWGINEKMICNVIGMFNSNLLKPIEVSKLDECLAPTKRRSIYINTTTLKNAGTASAFTSHDELYTTVLDIIKKRLADPCKFNINDGLQCE